MKGLLPSIRSAGADTSEDLPTVAPLINLPPSCIKQGSVPAINLKSVAEQTISPLSKVPRLDSSPVKKLLESNSKQCAPTSAYPQVQAPYDLTSS